VAIDKKLPFYVSQPEVTSKGYSGGQSPPC